MSSCVRKKSRTMAVEKKTHEYQADGLCREGFAEEPGGSSSANQYKGRHWEALSGV